MKYFTCIDALISKYIILVSQIVCLMVLKQVNVGNNNNKTRIRLINIVIISLKEATLQFDMFCNFSSVLKKPLQTF